MSKPLARLAAVLITCGLLLTAASAAAETLVVEDPPGDGSQPRLDITEVRIKNNDRALVFRVSFMRAGRGFLLVQVKDRGGDAASVHNLHRPARGDRTWFGTSDGETECAGLKVTWDHDLDTARVRVPSGCFQDGDYGAVRARFFTETQDDNDFAPNGTHQWRWSRLVARG